MRVIKETGEIELIRKACQITAKAHIETMQANARKRFTNEQQVAATFQYQAMMNGADGLAYDSIAASTVCATKGHYNSAVSILGFEKGQTKTFLIVGFESTRPSLSLCVY